MVRNLKEASVMSSETRSSMQLVSIPAGRVELSGEYVGVRAPRGLVVLACANHGNVRRRAEQLLIEQLHRSHIITLRIDLVTPEEAAKSSSTDCIRRDVELMAQRVVAIDRWAIRKRSSGGLPLGYYGSGAAACAALRHAAKQPGIDALVICEVRGDFEPVSEPDAELVCDLFRNWLCWEQGSRVRAAHSRPLQDRPSAPPQ